MNEQEQKKLYTKVVAKAWADEAYKQRLLNDPKKVLTEEGVEIPEGVNIHVTEKPHESTDSDLYFTLPAPDKNLTMENMEEKIAASRPVVMLHALLSAVNRTESFRIRLVTEDYVASYDTINLYTLELDREHLYHTALTGYSPSLRRFYESYTKSRREARRTDENKQPVPSLLNTITVSYLPGIRFTQIYERPISAAANKRGCLHLLVGKMEYENGRATVPVSIIFSHALLDGYDLEKGIAYITEKYGTEETEE